MKKNFSTVKSPYQPNLFRKKSRFAFTLAEVLITLGIIGVVAAMTIPVLFTNLKAHRLKAQFTETFSIVQQVFKQMEADEVSLNPDDYTKVSFYQVFGKYLKGTLDCGRLAYTPDYRYKPCYYARSQKYKSLDGKQTVNDTLLDDGELVLPSGALLLFENRMGGDEIWVHVDLNGYSDPPNRLGYDLFTFHFKDGELVTMGDKKSKYTDLDQYCNPAKSHNLNGIACAQKAKLDPDGYFKWVVKNSK